MLGDGRSLGLTIRGGAEYGLGIYITGVDPGSEAESSGLKVRGPALPWEGTGAGLHSWAEGGDRLCAELFEAGFSPAAEQAAPTSRAGPAGALPWLQPLIHSSERVAGAVRPSPSHAPSSPSRLSTGWPPTWCWAAGQPRLFMAAVLQTLLLGCNGPEAGVYYST